MNQINILNKHHGIAEDDRTIYVGRPSALGNPLTINDRWDRDFVVAQYKKWIYLKIQEQNEKVINALDHIANLVLDDSGKPVNLLCWCAPKKCHAEVIREVIIKAINEN